MFFTSYQISDCPFSAGIDFNPASRRQMVCDGLEQPASWRQILLIALVAAIFRILLGQFLIEPAAGFFWPKPTAPALANEITANVKMALLALLLVWTFAAFGEEIAYR